MTKHVYFDNIHHGKGDRSKYIYARLRDCATGQLVIGATMDYCLEAINERGWVVEPGMWAGDE